MASWFLNQRLRRWNLHSVQVDQVFGFLARTECGLHL